MSRLGNGLQKSLQEARDRNRQLALKKLENEFLPPLLEIQERPPAPWQHWVFWTLISLMVVAVLWSYFGEINIVATAVGQFVPDGRVKLIQPVAMATVEKVAVHDGELVQKGQILVTLNPTVSQAKLDAINNELQIHRLQKDRIEGQLGNASAEGGVVGPYQQMESALRQAQQAEHEAKLASARSRLEQNSATLAAARNQQQSLDEQSGLLQQELRGDQQLAALGAIPRQQYLNTRKQYLSLQTQLMQIKGEVAAATQRQSELQQEVAVIKQNYRARLLQDLNQNSLSLISLHSAQTEAQQDLQLHDLRAPVAGIVQHLSVRSPGQVVTPAQPVATIVPSDTPLVVEADLPDSHMAFVRVGQSARVKVNAYPFEQYGSLHGTVTSISADANHASNDKAPTGLFYRVRVKVLYPYLEIQGKKVGMRPGMSVSVNINTGKRRILQFFLSPLFRDWDEGLSVR